jgi:hypothetical protein
VCIVRNGNFFSEVVVELCFGTRKVPCAKGLAKSDLAGIFIAHEFLTELVPHQITNRNGPEKLTNSGTQACQ